jgi:integrase
VRTLCNVLHITGCRVSEALALTPEQVDLAGKAVVLETLKKCRRGVYRAAPVPPGGKRTRLRLDPGRHVQRLHGCERGTPCRSHQARNSATARP